MDKMKDCLWVRLRSIFDAAGSIDDRMEDKTKEN